jgi:Flp pilus assembly pilin Flp
MAAAGHDHGLGWCAQRSGARRAREQGTTAVGYAIMAAIVAVLLVGGVYLLVGSVSARFGDTGCAIAGPAPGKGNGNGDGHGHGHGYGHGKGNAKGRSAC